jgi:hypothetical protein
VTFVADADTGTASAGQNVGLASSDTAAGSDARVAVATPVRDVSSTSERVYLRLPHCYREADDAAGAPPNDQPLLRFLALAVDQAAELETLLTRFQSTGDLMNPQTADVAWLAWLAQVVGVRLPAPILNEAAARAAIATAAEGWQAGTKTAIANAVRAVLTGERFVQVNDHYLGNPWFIEIHTRPSQSPPLTPITTWDIMAATYPTWDATDGVTWGQVGGGDDPVLAAADRTKPAGYRLWHTLYEATWHTVEVALPSWDSAIGLTWDEVGDLQPPYQATWDTAGARFPTWADPVGLSWDQFASAH